MRGATEACIAATSMAWAHTIIAVNLSFCPTALLARINGAGSVLLLDSTLGPGLNASDISTVGTQGGLYLQAVTLFGSPEYAVEGLLRTPEGGLVASWGQGAAYASGVPLVLPPSAPLPHDAPPPPGTFFGHLPLPLTSAAVAAGVPLVCAAGGSSTSSTSSSAPLLCGGSAESPATGLAAAPGRPTFSSLAFLSVTTHYGAVGDCVADDTQRAQGVRIGGRASSQPLLVWIPWEVEAVGASFGSTAPMAAQKIPLDHSRFTKTTVHEKKKMLLPVPKSLTWRGSHRSGQLGSWTCHKRRGLKGRGLEHVVVYWLSESWRVLLVGSSKQTLATNKLSPPLPFHFGRGKAQRWYCWPHCRPCGCHRRKGSFLTRRKCTTMQIHQGPASWARGQPRAPWARGALAEPPHHQNQTF